MANLVVGGVTVAVARDGARETSQDLRDKIRMQDQSMRVFIIGAGQKRQWSITTPLLSSTDAATLKAALVTTTLPVACSGDILGGSVNCIPTLTEYAPVGVAGVIKRRVSFTLDEV